MAGLEGVTNVLKDFTTDLGAIELMIIYDLQGGDSGSVYPKKDDDLDKIASSISKKMGEIESTLKRKKPDFTIEENLVSTIDKVILTLRISKDYVLCIVGSINDFPGGYAKKMFKNGYKDDLKKAMREARLLGDGEE
ncbi:MAG: hypothetical protein ACRCU2_12310 [Planktothrix sp.]